MKFDKISLGCGSGGELYHQLIETVFLPSFRNPYLEKLADSAVCPVASSNIAITTDSFVVSPRFFPGGDIGRLAICGTVNDLAMSGASPLYITVGMIIEAGFDIDELKCICASMNKAAEEAGVLIVTGDTKVVDKGCCDGIFINTSGVGEFDDKTRLCDDPVATGDKILVSGNIADHGMAIMSARHNLGFDPAIESDSAPLNSLTAELLSRCNGIKLMRDPTRGGVSSTLNEWASATGLPINVNESSIPMAGNTRAACELLGIDPLYCANEGKMLAIVAADEAEKALSVMRKNPLGANAAIIGKIGGAAEESGVFVITEIGSKRVLGMIDGEQLPRIC